MPEQVDVAIIGAGLSGLCCGLALQKRGKSFRIYEAQARPGGRVATDDYQGFKLDHGFQVLHSAYPEARSQLDYKSLKLCSFYPGSQVRYNKRFYKLADPFKKPFAALRGIFFPIGTFRDKLLVAELRRQLVATSEDALIDIPEQTTLERLQKFGFTQSMIERFFKPFLQGIFLEDELRTSSRFFDFIFRMMALGDATLPSNGMAEIPQQLASDIPEQNILFSKPVLQVEGNCLIFGSGEKVLAKKVVLATNQGHASSLLGKSMGAEMKKVTTMYFATKVSPMSEPILCLNGEGKGLVMNMCVPSLVATGYAPAGMHLVSCSILGTPELSDEDLIREVRKQMKDWFGQQVDGWDHLKTFNVTHALPEQAAPTQFTHEGYAMMENSIYACGDYFGVASIQTAMRSGRLLGEKIALEMGQSAIV